MTCDARWTVRFPDVNSGEPFEIRPTEMTLKQERRKYDHLRAQFPWEVGQEMKPHTRYEGGALRGQQKVEVCLDGEPMQAMLFRPDKVDYTDDATHLELVDLQKSLDSGVVDKQWDQVKLKKAYEYAFSKRKDKSLLTDIKFMPEDIADEKIIGSSALDDTDSTDDFDASGATTIERQNQIQEIEQSDNYKLSNSYYAVDFNKVSPAKAIWKLNEKYRLMTWADADGTLWVGTPETTMNRHLAAQDDDRVWYFSDASISHPREPVQNVVVEGRWVDEPGAGTVDDIVSWFNPSDSDGFGDFRATGVASRTDIDYGLTFTVKNTGAKRDALNTVAKVALREEMKQQNSGSVEIDPELSGDDLTEVRNVALGDFLQLIPDDDHFENPTATSGQTGETPAEIQKEACGDFIHNEIYVVTGIQHSVAPEDGWTVHLDVAMYPDDPMESFVRYFNPRSGDYMTEEEVYDGDWVEEDSKF